MSASEIAVVFAGLAFVCCSAMVIAWGVDALIYASLDWKAWQFFLALGLYLAAAFTMILAIGVFLLSVVLS